MEFIAELSVGEIATLWVIIGLINLLVTVRLVQKDPLEFSEFQFGLGKYVQLLVFAWPYTLICRIFSWPIWLMPVRDLIPRIEYINTIYAPSLAIIMILLANLFGFIEFRLS